jgi:hypothetical protein
MPFHSTIEPHTYGPGAWAAWLAFCALAGHRLTRVLRRAH